MDESGSLPPGTVLGGEYEIVRELAKGGMGALYVARHGGSDKLRAVKTMHRRYVPDAAMRGRFAREAKVSAQIESDHVVEVFGAGVDERTGVPWMAMELLDGEDLARIVERRGALPPSEVATVVAQLGHCLGAAHRAGIVHRDLKPANVFLAASRRQGAPSVVKVLDFGIAKFLHVVATSATTSAIGSPLWMAPEQTNPERPVAPATDVWSLGLLTFFLLTGKCFWLTPTYANASIAALLGELLMLPLPTASSRAHALGVTGGVPPGFDGWFARCLARDPAERFADANAAVPPLLAVLQTAPPSAAAAPTMGSEAARAAGMRLSAIQMLPQTPPASAARGGEIPPTMAMPVMAMPAATASLGMPSLPVTRSLPVQPVESHRPAPVGAPPPARAGRSVAVVTLAALLTVALAATGIWAFRRPADPPPRATATAVAPAQPAPQVALAAPVSTIPKPPHLPVPAPAPALAPAVAPAPAAAPAPAPPEPSRRSHRRDRSPEEPSRPGGPVFQLPTLAPMPTRDPSYERPRDPYRRRRWGEPRERMYVDPLGRSARKAG